MNRSSIEVRTQRGFGTFLATATGAVALCAALPAQFFADTVVAHQSNAQAGGGIFQPGNALGAPAGGSDVHSLGIQGSLTLGFSNAITNGPGADLIVHENPFRSTSNLGNTFAEVCFVEVSTDGVHFARFPSRYYGPMQSPGPFSFVPVGSYSGLAGVTPSFVNDPTVDPRDLVEAGGDAFDLNDLASDPLVVQGLVVLDLIHQVRLVDVLDGIDVDSTGTPIQDPGSGSADIDAVTAIHQIQTLTLDNPTVDLQIQNDGTMTLRIEDPNGRGDLDPLSLRAALFGLPVDAGGLLATFTLQSVDATGYTLVQPVPLPQSMRFSLAFSIRDLAGHHSGSTRTRPTP
ncbi:MAG: hypothetical protein ACE37K_03040 [Planctomycetota bacterium]